MRRTVHYEVEEEIECPDCGRDIPIRSEICPHCEIALH